jgi:hypothetical protein
MKFLLKYILLFVCVSLSADSLLKVDNDSTKIGELLSTGGTLVAEYDEFSIISMPILEKAVSFSISSTSTADSSIVGVEDASYMREIKLNSGTISTGDKEFIRAFTTSAVSVPSEFSGMQLLQFVGPVKGVWIDEVKQKTGLKFVNYIPNNAYLISGSEEQFDDLEDLDLDYVQWLGEYSNDMRLQPGVADNIALGDVSKYSVQLLLDDILNEETLQLLKEFSNNSFSSYKMGGLSVVNCVAELSGEQVTLLSKQQDVISINLYYEMQLHGERQALVMADKFLSDGTLPLPRTNSYLEWFIDKGFTQQQFIDSGFIVDVTDDGFDNGDATNPGNSEFCVSNNATLGSRVAYAEIALGTSGISNPAGADGHGNLNLSIIGGFNNGTGTPTNIDPQGYHYGLGIVPFAMLGSTKIFTDSGSWGNPIYRLMVDRQYANGARIHSDSWGANTPLYTSDAQIFDYFVRDASISDSGNQEMIFVFSAGNAGPSASSIGSPGTAKNVFTVGGSENYDADLNYTDGSGITPAGADNVNDITSFSSRGPTKDGRIKPDIVAPASHIHGAASQYAGYTGDGVSDKYNPVGQTKYAESSGTSHSCPAVSAASALLRQWFINHGDIPPSPAMNKAWIMNSARYLTGAYGNDDLPSNSQGMGAASLATMLDDTERFFVDQDIDQLFTASGNEFSFVGEIVDTQKMFRVTLAWTDAPGSTTGAAYVNDLDLIVLINDIPYYGNVFVTNQSAVGGSGDRINNVESVFLPAGLSGNVEVKVLSVNIAGDGVPGNDTLLDQDFALVSYNTDLHLKEAGELSVTPSVPANFVSFNGGDNIYPESFTYSLINTGDDSLQWQTSSFTNVFDVFPGSGILDGHSTQDVAVSVHPQQYDAGVYNDILSFTNLTAGSSISRVATLDVRTHDYYTEEFVGGVNDLSYQSIVFVKSGTNYTTYLNETDDFFADIDDATRISLTDDGYYECVLDSGKTFPFFDNNYNSLYISANGRITFGQSSTEYIISLDNYFALPAISAMFADLSPQNGKTYVEKQSDKIVVTFIDVPGYNETTVSSFQYECFFDGTIRITYGAIDITRIFLVGLSDGQGLPAEFVESDFSSYPEINYNMSITAPSEPTFIAINGEAISPTAHVYEMLNSGDEALNWTVSVSSSNDWLSVVGATSGVLDAGLTTNILFSADDSVGGFSVGDVYMGEIQFESLGNPIANIYELFMSYEDPMTIIPNRDNILFSKVSSTSYEPDVYSLVITNRADQSLEWGSFPVTSSFYMSVTNGLIQPYGSQQLDLNVNPIVLQYGDSIYTEDVAFSNKITSVVEGRTVYIRNAKDFFTQVVSDGSTLANKSFMFVPSAGNTNYYVAYCNTDIEEFYVEPSEDNLILLTDDGIENVAVNHQGGINFYGTNYTNIFINGNGRISFVEGSAGYSATLANHFALTSIAPMLSDLSPQNGTVTCDEFVDRLVVTYIDVPEYGTGNYNSFQIEFFFDGKIRLTYLNVTTSASFICGLSNGNGIPSGFVESDMLFYQEYIYDALSISPEVGYSINARQNISLDLYDYQFVLSNTSQNSFHWTAAASNSWISVMPEFGVLAGGDSIAVTATVSTDVNSFDLGKYINYLEFSNVDSGYSDIAPMQFEMLVGIGNIEITSSEPAFSDNTVSFGYQQLGVPRTESIFVENTDSQYPVEIKNIRLNKKYLPIDGTFSLTNKNVLLYADDYMRQKEASYPYQVLTDMGATVTVYGSGYVDAFYNSLIAQDWDMVILSSEYYYMPNYAGITDLEAALIEYADSGKPLIAGSWCATYWGDDLWERLGADVSGGMIDEPVNIIGLGSGSMFFHQPKVVLDPIGYAFTYFNYYGCSASLSDFDFAIPISEYSVAADYSPFEDADYSVLYMENCVYKGFVDSAFDVNSGIKDLWYNMIYNLNLNSFSYELGLEYLPVTILPGEKYEIPVLFDPGVEEYYESELMLGCGAMNVTNVGINITGSGISATGVTTGYRRWRDQFGDHLVLTNSVDVGSVTDAFIGGVPVEDIQVDHELKTIELMFDEINSTNLLDVVYNATAGEFTVTNLFAYYSEYIFVSPLGREQNGFSSWTDASKTIQEAVDVASEWALVRVGNGLYTVSPASRVLSGPTASVTNVVVLNKNIVLRGVDLTSSSLPIINGWNLFRPVLMLDGTVLDNFILLNGRTKSGANLFIENNGGGVWAQSHDAVLENLEVMLCEAGHFGGAIFGGTLKNSVIRGCSSTYGGGIGYGNITTNVVISFCTAEYGGAVSKSIVANSILEFNSATFGGGASDSDIQLSSLYNNSASYGGAIFGDNYSSDIEGCLITANSAENQGGAFFQNPYGTSQTTFNNCTVTENLSNFGSCGGIYGGVVLNSIIYGNLGYDLAGGAAAFYSNIGTGSVPAGQGNISLDPKFNLEYELLPSSPCLDAGLNQYVVNNVDLLGNPRISHGIVDMGAYETPWFSILATNSAFGTIAPKGVFDVVKGTNIVFEAVPDNHYRFDMFKTNNIAVENFEYSFEWTNIVSDGMIGAFFDEVIITNGMSESWLSEFYPTATNYNELSDMDTDGDGLVSWQEYVALTVPTNEESLFLITINSLPAGTVISWSPFDDNLRTYSVEGTTDLMAPFIIISNDVQNGSMTIPASQPWKFFKSKVEE